MNSRTLAIIKPDAVGAGKTGEILAQLESEGFRICGMRMLALSSPQAERFYAVHAQRPFFGSLVKFMTSGPCVPVVLEAPSAVERFRQVIGATDPARAEEGTVRSRHGSSIERNAVHGSDSPENARIEARFFFADRDLSG